MIKPTLSAGNLPRTRDEFLQFAIEYGECTQENSALKQYDFDFESESDHEPELEEWLMFVKEQFPEFFRYEETGRNYFGQDCVRSVFVWIAGVAFGAFTVGPRSKLF